MKPTKEEQQALYIKQLETTIMHLQDRLQESYTTIKYLRNIIEKSKIKE